MPYNTMLKNIMKKNMKFRFIGLHSKTYLLYICVSETQNNTLSAETVLNVKNGMNSAK